jgi:PAS domain S-box-containing protein
MANGVVIGAVGKSAAALVTLDFQGRITGCNAHAKIVYGYSADEIVGKSFSCLSIAEGESADGLRSMLEEAKRVGSCEVETSIRHKGEESIPARLTVDAVYDVRGHVAGFTALTQSIVDQGNLQKGESNVSVQKRKMDALQRMGAGIAHEFNNIFHVIANVVEILQLHSSDLKPEASKYLDAAKRSINRASALTRRLLAFSQHQFLNPKLIDINSVVAEAVEELRQQLDENIELQVITSETVGLCLSDILHLKTAIINVALNARDAMRSGGTLTIRTENEGVCPTVAADQGVEAGRYSAIAISDSGQGMTPEVLERAFDPYFTTKEKGQGSGLGLSEVYGLIRQFRGYVDISTKPGVGTTVTLYLPQFKDGEAASRDVSGGDSK